MKGTYKMSFDNGRTTNNLLLSFDQNHRKFTLRGRHYLFEIKIFCYSQSKPYQMLCSVLLFTSEALLSIYNCNLNCHYLTFITRPLFALKTLVVTDVSQKQYL